jgi:hypothetical protein
VESLGVPFRLQEFKLARRNLPAISGGSWHRARQAAIYSNWCARLHTPLSKFSTFAFQLWSLAPDKRWRMQQPRVNVSC